MKLSQWYVNILWPHWLSDSHAQRRRSLRKSNAISSFGESETGYSLHRFKLNSKDSSTDDFFVLKVKTRSYNSLISPTSLQSRFFTESLEKDSIISPKTEKDSPAYSYYRRESDQPKASNDSSLFIRRGSGMADKKSMSEPARVSTLLMLPSRKTLKTVSV